MIDLHWEPVGAEGWFVCVGPWRIEALRRDWRIGMVLPRCGSYQTVMQGSADPGKCPREAALRRLASLCDETLTALGYG